MDAQSVIKERESLQYNAQDLDQEQNMDVNPVQTNTQNLHVTVNNEKIKLTGRLYGTTYSGRSKYILGNICIAVFFGYDSNIPVCKAKSDANGNFSIDDLPTGYYSVRTQNDCGEGRIHYVKLLPGQEVSLNLFI